MSITRTFALALATAAIPVAAFASAATASALNPDQAFLQDLQANNIGFKSPEAALKVPQAVCQERGAGTSPTAIGREIMSASNLTSHQAAVVVVDSVKMYCPQYSSALPT
jgi:hypothetical protein